MGSATSNAGGVTLHQCCALPVVSYTCGFSADVPPPTRAVLENKALWNNVVALFVDEISFVSKEMLERMHQHLRPARCLPAVPHGGIHLVVFGDLYQLPPPAGLPVYAAPLLRSLFELSELGGNHRATRDPGWAALLGRVRVGAWTEEDLERLRAREIPAEEEDAIPEKAVKLFDTRAAVAGASAARLRRHLAGGVLRVPRLRRV